MNVYFVKIDNNDSKFILTWHLLIPFNILGFILSKIEIQNELAFLSLIF